MQGGAPPLLETISGIWISVQIRVFTMPYAASLGGFDDEPIRLSSTDAAIGSAAHETHDKTRSRDPSSCSFVCFAGDH